MNAKRRVAVIVIAGCVMIGAAAAYAARDAEGPIDRTTLACVAPTISGNRSFDRMSAAEVDSVTTAVLDDPLLARLTDVSKLAVKSPANPTGPGIYVMAKATQMPGIGRTAMIVQITLPNDIPTGVHRFRVTEQTVASDCTSPTALWLQDIELDVASLQGAMPKTLFAQVALEPVRVVYLVPTVIDPARYRRVGERVYLVGGR